MKDFSLFKFSRYFFVLFLIITVLPLVSLLLWSHYDLEQNLLNRQKQFLEMDINRTINLFQQQLISDHREIAETSQSIRGKSLSLDEYKGIFNVEEAWWLDSKSAKLFFAQHPETQPTRETIVQKIYGDYFPGHKAIQSFFVVPLANKHQGLLLIKTLPAENLAPNGPYQIKIYSGNQMNVSTLILQSDFRWQRPRFGPPHEFAQGPEHHFAPPDAFSQGPPGPMQGPPHSFAPSARHCFGPPPFEHGEKRCAPNFGKVMIEKSIHLTNHAGSPVATVDIKVFSPPHHFGDPLGRQNQWIGLLILCTGILTSLLAGSYIRKNFIEPLMRLAQVATQVQDGDLSSRVETQNIKQRDVRQTLEKFNAMLSGLAEKEQLRSSFISNLTHDFRTPLVAQRRSLELLAEELQQLSLVQPEKLAMGLLKNSEHLLTMVNQLLETYQTEAGSFTLDLSEESLPLLVNQCFEQLAPLSEDRQITLTQQFPDHFPKLMVDSYYLKRVFINLIGNAIENIPKKSQIKIIGKCHSPDRVEIHVKDNGLGIPLEEQQHLFDRYYAGTTGDTRKLGSGLGLYICAVLIAAHQGTISVDSVEGDYTDFIIHLPVFSKQKDSHEPNH